MAYEPKTWECGETITADALNHLEQGLANVGGGGTAVYELTRDTTTGCYTLGASYNDLVASGGGVAHLSMGSTGDAYLNIAAYAHKGNTYMAVAVSPDIGYEDEPITQLVLSASSADANFTNCSSPQPPTPEPN